MDQAVNQNTPQEHNELDDRFLLFQIEEKLYGMPLSVVLEIINVQNLTYLPCVAPYIKGIINLRGKVVPVVDLRLKLGLPERPADDMTCIVVLTLREMQVGMIVDRVCEVLTLTQKQLCAAPTAGHASDRFLTSVVQLNDKIMLNLDAEVLFEDELQVSL